MELSCVSGVQVGHQEKGCSLLRGWLVTGTSSPGKWSQHQACQTSKNIWMLLLVIRFSFIQSCKEKGVGLLMILMRLFQFEIFSDPSSTLCTLQQQSFPFCFHENQAHNVFFFLTDGCIYKVFLVLFMYEVIWKKKQSPY